MDFTSEKFQKAFKMYFKDLGVTVDDWAQIFDKMNQKYNNKAYVRVSETDDIIGFIQFCDITQESWFFKQQLGFIREFWVNPIYQGSGHGKALIALVEEYYSTNGIHKIILTTDSTNGFYEKCGYILDQSIVAKNDDDVYIKNI